MDLINFNITSFLDFLNHHYDKILIIFILVIGLIFLKNKILKYLVKKLAILLNLPIELPSNYLFNKIKGPINIIPLILIFIALAFFLDESLFFYSYILNFIKSLIVIFLFWIFLVFMFEILIKYEKNKISPSSAIFYWIKTVSKYILFFLGLVITLEIWGIKIAPLIAGLGLFGVAVALGAQDLFKNLISGLMIIVENNYKIGDVVRVPGHTHGTIEHIGLRSTIIRDFDSIPVALPNHIFSDLPVVNYSNRKFRRIQWNIGVEYNTSLEKLKLLNDEIMNFIEGNNDFVKNENFKCIIRIDKFNDSSIDVYFSAFTNTNDWLRYLDIKENFAIHLKSLMDQKGISFAFPSRTIYHIDEDLNKKT
jgi:MscS family membrane protein